MGTPIRPIDLIFSEHTVDAAELEVADRLAIVEKLRRRFLPHLKYMPGFKEIRDKTNMRLNAYDRRETDLGVVKFDVAIFQHTRCIDLATIWYTAYGENPAGSNYGCHFVEREELLLTQDGEVLKWRQKYRREAKFGPGGHGHRSAIYEVAESSVFTRVLEGDLARELAETKNFSQILSALNELVQTSVKEREHRLRSMKDLEQFTGMVLSHISMHPHA